VLHLDVPPGNVPLSAVNALKTNPLVAEVIPISLGDNFQGYRIVGTSLAYPQLYAATLAQGRMWDAPMQVVLGATVARALGLGLGQGLGLGLGQGLGLGLVLALQVPPGALSPQAPLTVVLEFQSQHEAHMFGHFRVSVSPSRFPLKKEMLKPLKPEILTIFSKSAAERSNEEKNQLRQALIDLDITGAFRAMRTEQNQLQAQKKAMAQALPRVMVMSDAQPRKTHVYSRGSYEMPLEEVSSNTPAVLPPMPQDQPKNRLGLARWLVSAENPLTARVQVNRIWQLYFGHGLVKSSENFGLQGDTPTHPELLDWLAVEFRESGWDVKHMHRLIVTSATYRQSSRVTAPLLVFTNVPDPLMTFE
jgi:hypothetical protein